VALVLLLLPQATRLAASLEPIIDPDVWWHLAAGRWIVDHGSIPSVDPFHTRGESREWLDYSWSADAAWWLGYRHIGLAAPLVYAALIDGMLLVLCALLARVDRPSRARRAFAAGIAYLALGSQLVPRTYLVTTLFTGIVLLFVRAVREGAPVRRGIALPALFMVWANVHVEFLYGWFFLGVAAVEALLQGRRERRRALELLGLTALCVAGAALNPFGPRLLLRLFGWIRAYGHSDIVIEMQALAFRQPEDYLLLALLSAAVVALVQTRDRSLYRWVSLVFAAWASFHSRRASWMIAVVSLDAIQALPVLSATTTPRGRASLLPALGVGAAVAVAAFACAAAARRESLVATERFPFGAVRYAREHALVGPIYNHYNWGGFLRFELPDVPGNIDGRGPIFSTQEIDDVSAAWRGEPGWGDDPLLQRAGFVVASVHTAMAQLLRLDARFRVAYEDAVSVVFVRAR
jgi:hypothetical protein